MKKINRAGIVRNKYESFLHFKDRLKQKESRFAKKTPQRTSHTLSESTSIASRSLLDKNGGVQMSLMGSLPPDWVDKYEECQAILRQVDDLKRHISGLYSKRLNSIDEKDEALYDRTIYEKSTEATKKIAQCERFLREIRNSVESNDSGYTVCINLTSSLALMIQQRTKELRGQQRGYIENRKRLDNSTKVSFLELAVEKTLGGEMYEDDMQIMSTEHLQMQTRNKEILKLVDTINDLNEIYKQLSNLVIVQGTLLDRIDVNLQASISHVKEGKKHLQQALQRQKSPLACRCIVALVVCIGVMALILILKFSR